MPTGRTSMGVKGMNLADRDGSDHGMQESAGFPGCDLLIVSRERGMENELPRKSSHLPRIVVARKRKRKILNVEKFGNVVGVEIIQS